MISSIIVQLVGTIRRGLGNDDVSADLVEAMKVKYADIDIDEEIDIWLGLS